MILFFWIFSPHIWHFLNMINAFSSAFMHISCSNEMHANHFIGWNNFFFSIRLATHNLMHEMEYQQPKLDSDMDEKWKGSERGNKLVPHRLFMFLSIYAKMHQYSILVLDIFGFSCICDGLLEPLVHQIKEKNCCKRAHTVANATEREKNKHNRCKNVTAS